MRVVLVSLNARTGDAIGRQLVEKVAALVERGLTVHVVVVDQQNTHPALKPYVVRWRPGDQPSWKVLTDADLIVVEYSQFHPLLEWLPLLADARRRFIFDYHGLTPPELALPSQRGDLLRGQDWLGLAQLADVVVAHSRFAKVELLESVDVPPASFMSLGYPVEPSPGLRPPSPAKPGEGRTRSLRERLHLKDKRVLLFVGRLAPNKCVPLLIKALAELGLEYHALIVGPSGGAYESERLKCKELAADLGVADQVHWLGEVDEATLKECYETADVFVMPSKHEGFCLPVIEAMRHGLPVVASRAGALPETVADAGLLFEIDDGSDLVRQVRRVCNSAISQAVGWALPTMPAAPILRFNRDIAAGSVGSAHPTAAKQIYSNRRPQRVAVVTPRFGNTTGGAERSLSLMARQLYEAGRDVTVFTTNVDNAETTPFSVRYFPINPPLDSDGWYRTSDSETEAGYWQNTLRSDELVKALKQEDFDAVIVGPYLMGLTRDVVRVSGSKAILVGCLHDEPAAQLPGVRQMIQSAGGVLYHSQAECDLALSMGLSHPNSNVIGTVIDTKQRGDVNRGRRLVGTNQYFVYCGRMIREKGVDELIARARQFAQSRPEAKFVFIGAGDLTPPNETWAIHLGVVSENDKRDIISGAAALITLSTKESLSLVVLEANALGVPAVVKANCPAMETHIVAGGGGLLIRHDADFERCLDRLLDYPSLRRELGENGRRHVCEQFGSSQSFQTAILEVLDRLHTPIRDQLIERGLQRAQKFDRQSWREQFEQVVDAAMSSTNENRPAVVEIMASDGDIPANELVAIQLTHMGGKPLIPTGPARTELVVRLRTADGDIIADEIAIPFRRWLMTGHTQLLALALPNQDLNGEVVVDAGLRTRVLDGEPIMDWHGPIAHLNVVQPSTHQHIYIHSDRQFSRSIDRIRQSIELPTGYVDVTTGWGSRLKKWIKAKVLHNFRTAYVDVLARQQTRFNRRVVESLEQMADVPDRNEAKMQSEIAQARQHFDELAARVGQLEAAQRRPSKAQR